MRNVDLMSCLDLSSFKNVINRVQQHYVKTEPHSTVTWRIGCPVAALYTEDGSYYRAKVTGFDDSGVVVIVEK
jgi:hypothetical protein